VKRSLDEFYLCELLDLLILASLPAVQTDSVKFQNKESCRRSKRVSAARLHNCSPNAGKVGGV
jgi:hypothetical protein